MNRTNKSILIAITSTANNLLNSLVGLALTSLIIKVYGSDFNGLTSSSSQFINMLMIVEGGFTTAINVALFKPYVENDVVLISKIRYTAEKKFKKIGIIFILIGFITALIYAFLIKTSYNYLFVLMVLIMAIVPTFLNIYMSLKWKILFQMEQNDYIINLITIVTVLICNIINIVLVFRHIEPIWTRVIIMSFSIFNTLIVCYLGRKKYSKYVKKVMPDPNLIKGVNDVFILNLTGVIYSSYPILYITTTAGTAFASVYAVYNGIFLIIKSIVHSILRAPTIGLGQVINEDSNRAKKIFHSYQFSSFLLTGIFLSVTLSIAIPFVSLLTKGTVDLEYENITLLLLLACIFFFESVHIPSGQMIIMSGKYRLCKRIQIIALIIIIIGSIIGNYFLGFYGTIITVCLASIILCALEVFFNYYLILKESIYGFIKLFIITIMIISLNIIINTFIKISINTYFTFICVGIIYTLINTFVSLIIYYIFCKNECVDILLRIKRIMFSIFKKIFSRRN